MGQMGEFLQGMGWCDTKQNKRKEIKLSLFYIILHEMKFNNNDLGSAEHCKT